MWKTIRWIAAGAIALSVHAGTGMAGEAPKDALAKLPLPKSQAALEKMKLLQGKWKVEDGEDVLNFQPGQLLGASNPMVKLEAVYTVAENGDLKILMGLPNAVIITRKVKVGKNALLLTDTESNITLKYKRVK